MKLVRLTAFRGTPANDTGPIHRATCSCTACRHPGPKVTRAPTQTFAFRMQAAVLLGAALGFYLATFMMLPEILAAFGAGR